MSKEALNEDFMQSLGQPSEAFPAPDEASTQPEYTGDILDQGQPLNSEQQARIDEIMEALKDVMDPELGINIVDLGLVYGLHLDEDDLVIDMTLTSAGCPLTDLIEQQCRFVLGDLVATTSINWVWLPPWGPDKITDDGREQLRALGFNV